MLYSQIKIQKQILKSNNKNKKAKQWNAKFIDKVYMLINTFDSPVDLNNVKI